MNFPKISIVTPNYNGGKYLEETILSVISQNYPNLEYIIIDGGSTDNSIDIIKKYEDKITFWTSEPDMGQADAINKGFNNATGTILGWINSDDFYVDNILNEIAQFYLSTHFDFVMGTIIEIDAQRKFLQKGFPVVTKNVNPFKWRIYQPGTFFSKTLFEQFGPFVTHMHYAFDMEFWIRLRLNNVSFFTINKDVAYFRRHDETKSAGGNNNFRNELFKYYVSLYKNNKKKDNISLFKLLKLIIIFSNRIIEQKNKELDNRIKSVSYFLYLFLKLKIIIKKIHVKYER